MASLGHATNVLIFITINTQGCTCPSVNIVHMFNKHYQPLIIVRYAAITTATVLSPYGDPRSDRNAIW